MSDDIRAIVVPHLYGISARIEDFQEFGVPVIEDCAQAFAPSWGIRGTVAVYSFHPTKCLTTAEGGMAATRDKDILERLRIIRDGSSSRTAARVLSPMSDLAAALGTSQFDCYDEALVRRTKIARNYLDAFRRYLPACLDEDALEGSMFFRFPIKVPGGVDSCSEAFAQKGVVVRRGVDTLLHRYLGRDREEFANSEWLYANTVSLPIYPDLTDSDQEKVTTVALSVLQ